MESLIQGLDETQLNLLLILSSNNESIKLIGEHLGKTEPHTLTTPEAREKLQKVKDQFKKIEEALSSKIKEIATGDPMTSKLIQKKPIRVYMDGCFDAIHYGHMNAIRQAKALGDILIVGINKGDEIEKAKGPTIMDDEERIALASACKFGDEFVGYTAYTPTVKLLDELNADYCAHGDDIAFNELGQCCYDEIIKAGRMKYFRRTEGISTTDLTGKLLFNILTEEDKKTEIYKQFEQFKKPAQSKFLTTSRRMALFSNNKAPKPEDKVVYFPGDFDLLGIGTIEALKKAKEAGDFVYLGVYDDDIVHKLKGSNYPFLNVNERTMNLLALRYVDEVVINPMYKINEEFIKVMKINVVFNAGKGEDKSASMNYDGLGDPFEIPKKMGIYQYAEVEHEISNKLFEERIAKHKDHFMKKFIKKTINDEKSKAQSKIQVDEI
ncbi:MAG: adenylyltransferase/cytidyltransferase family protein [archaeon]|nr:adenylyltransferase/cytidyltransferase family protein [archaeon]